MRTMRFWLCMLAGALGAFAAAVASGQVLYGTTAANTTTSNLYILDPATGAVVSTVGPIGFAVTGLAVNPLTGVLYGSTSNNSANSPGSLITINKATGQGTLVGSYGSSGETMADITFTSDGTLYGWLEPGTDDLHTINLATGAATDVGNAGLSTFGSGLAANSADVLYYAGSGSDGMLRTVSRATGLTTDVAVLTGGPASSSSISALAFSPGGTLYGVFLDETTKASQLLTINPTTAAITILGPSITALDAIVFDGGAAPPPPPTSSGIPIPALSPVMMALLALLVASGTWLALRRRR